MSFRYLFVLSIDPTRASLFASPDVCVFVAVGYSGGVMTNSKNEPSEYASKKPSSLKEIHW